MARRPIWEDRPEKVFAVGIDAYQQDVIQALRQLARYYAPQIEAWMKQQARWTDRTGNARQSLYTEVEDMALGAMLAMDYGVEYGFWLEFANQGDYAIVKPALDHWGPLIWAAVQRTFAK